MNEDLCEVEKASAAAMKHFFSSSKVAFLKKNSVLEHVFGGVQKKGKIC